MNSYRNPQAQWLGSPNYSLNREGHDMAIPPSYIIMHTMVGTVASANSRFQQAAQQASAHYGVGLDGHLVQWVDEKDAAWHAGNYGINLDSIGIEHEDGGQYNSPRTPALKATSAKLIAEICTRYGIPCNRSYIRLHKEVSSTPTACPDSLEVDEIIGMAQALLGGGDNMSDDILNLLHDLAQMAAFGGVDQSTASRDGFRAAANAGNATKTFIGWLTSPQGQAWQAKLAKAGVPAQLPQAFDATITVK